MTKAVLFGGVFKTALLGGAGGAVYLSNILDVPDELMSKPKKLTENDIPATIGKVEDIELYERYYGCRFVFIKAWDSKETYNWREFLMQHKGNTTKPWKDLVVKGADKLKESCKKGWIVTLSFKGAGFETMHLTS